MTMTLKSIPATLRKLAEARPEIQKDWADLTSMADALDAHLSAIEAAERDAARAKLEAERDFLHDWLQYAFYPVGMDCCGRGQGGECCGDGVPAYATLADVQQAMNKRLSEIEDAIDATQEGEA